MAARQREAATAARRRLWVSGLHPPAGAPCARGSPTVTMVPVLVCTVPVPGTGAGLALVLSLLSAVWVAGRCSAVGCAVHRADATGRRPTPAAWPAAAQGQGPRPHRIRSAWGRARAERRRESRVSRAQRCLVPRRLQRAQRAVAASAPAWPAYGPNRACRGPHSCRRVRRWGRGGGGR